MARLGPAALAAAASLLVGAAGAQAATVQVQPVVYKADYLNDRIVLRAAPGEASDVRIVPEMRDTVTVSDRVPLTAGRGCQAVTATSARCTFRGDLSLGFVASLGDRDDALDAADLDAWSSKLLGGPGNDRLVGPAAASDTIFSGGPGDDRLVGGPGHDSIRTGEDRDRVDADDGVLDAILCSTGRDRIRHDGADFLLDACGRRRPIPGHVVPLTWADGGDKLFLALGCPFRPGRACTSEATLAVTGQSFGPRQFTLAPGRYGWLLLPLGARTEADPDPPLDGGVLTLGGASVPLSEVHRDPSPIPFFLPPLLPLL